MKFQIPAGLILSVISSTAFAQPVITSFSPQSGPPAATITITGTGFNATAANNFVYFGVAKANVTAATTTSLQVTVSYRGTYSPISVTNSATQLTGYSKDYFTTTFPNCGLFTDAHFESTRLVPSGSGPSVVVARDMDQTVSQDIVLANAISRTLVIHPAQNQVYEPPFAPEVLIASSIDIGQLVLGDLNGDSRPEVIATIDGTSTIAVFHNQLPVGTISAAGFTRQDFTVGAGVSGVTLADIDGDGRIDIVTSNLTDNSISVLRNNFTAAIGPSSFYAATSFSTGAGPSGIAFADFDLDGKQDLVTVNPVSANVSVLHNTSSPGTISFSAKTDCAAGLAPIGLAVGDLDKSGGADILVGNAGSAELTVLRNTSIVNAPSFATAVSIPLPAGTSASSLLIACLKGDGKPDIVLTSPTTNSIIVLNNQSTAGNLQATDFVVTAAYPLGGAPSSVFATDIDASGRAELIVARPASNDVAVVYSRQFPFTDPNVVTASTNGNECTVDGWTHYYTPGNPSYVMFSLQKNGNNLGAVTGTSFVESQPVNISGKRLLARHYKITVGTQPATPVGVRLYYTNAEVQALQAVDPSVTSVYSLNITKYHGPNEDGVYDIGSATDLQVIPPGSIFVDSTQSGEWFMQFNVNSFSEFWLGRNINPLPVKLMSFQAYRAVSSVQLKWATSSEENSSQIVIERSDDGRDYLQLGSLAAAGTSNVVTNYAFKDDFPVKGRNIYRLKIVDLDGKFEYSPLQSVEWGSSSLSVRVYPQPSTGQLNVDVDGSDEVNRLVMSDLFGRKVHEQVVVPGTNKIDVRFAAGYYIYSVLSSEGMQVATGKVMVR